MGNISGSTPTGDSKHLYQRKDRDDRPQGDEQSDGRQWDEQVGSLARSTKNPDSYWGIKSSLLLDSSSYSISSLESQPSSVIEASHIVKESAPSTEGITVVYSDPGAVGDDSYTTELQRPEEANGSHQYSVPLNQGKTVVYSDPDLAGSQSGSDVYYLEEPQKPEEAKESTTKFSAQGEMNWDVLAIVKKGVPTGEKIGAGHFKEVFKMELQDIILLSKDDHFKNCKKKALAFQKIMKFEYVDFEIDMAKEIMRLQKMEKQGLKVVRIRCFLKSESGEYYIVSKFCNQGDLESFFKLILLKNDTKIPWLKNLKHFIVSKSIKKGMLESFVKSDNFNLVKRLLLVKLAFVALSSLHKTGHLHHDIKLDNFLVHLKKNGMIEVLINDFGLMSKKGGSNEPPRVRNLLHAPSELDTWNQESFDVWMAGCLLAQVYMGKSRENLPWYDSFLKLRSLSDPEKFLEEIKIFIKAKKDLGAFLKDLSEDDPVRPLIEKMMDPDPKKRPSIDEAVGILDTIIEKIILQTPST